MKNAIKLQKKIYHSLTDDDKDILKNAINKVINNHDDDSWTSVYLGIVGYIRLHLSRTLSDDVLAELDKREMIGVERE